ncbi:MAG: fasciclin domain-containing protein [Flavobacteriaceae bacterium]|nr:fasciclin domain-containing protein [Flavobacteriaceae bacterium]
MKSKFFTIVLLFLFIFYSCNTEKKQDMVKSEVKQEQKAVKDHGQAGVAAVEGEQLNALQVAKSIEDFSTLVVAIETAGVQDAVVNTGPLTILAPLNSAFAKLPEGTVETLLKPENKAKLAFILVNHVAPANYPIKQLKKEAKKGRKLYVASGEYLVVEDKDGEIYVGGTKILKSVKVSNGWIHVIDDVLVPAE